MKELKYLKDYELFHAYNSKIKDHAFYVYRLTLSKPCIYGLEVHWSVNLDGFIPHDTGDIIERLWCLDDSFTDIELKERINPDDPSVDSLILEENNLM